MGATIISLATQKGGSGKSTLTVLIATALHNRTGKRVLVIDADFQQTINDNRTQEGERRNSFEIVSFDYEKYDFTKFITGVFDRYDYILIDTPGRLQGKDLGIYISISDFVIVPIVASLYDINSTIKFLQAIEPVRNKSGFKVLGVINKKDRTLEHDIIKNLQGVSGLKILNSSISNLARYKRLSTHDTIVTANKKDDEFNLFFNELLMHII